MSAFFSGMEIAFLSKNRLREEIDRKQSPVFDFIAQLFERNSGQYITTILVGNNICLVVYSLYMSLMLRMVASVVGWESMANEGSVLLETIISTVVILFCGEFLPKSIFADAQKAQPIRHPACEEMQTEIPVLYLIATVSMMLPS